MSLVHTATEIDYPETDGKPMGETDVHRKWMIRLYDLLQYRYRHERVYIGSDLLVYYTEDTPRDFVVPDVFVVRDCDPGPRRVFKIWEEGRAPDVVFEVTSRGTRQEDEIFKPKLYSRIGVRELFLYDPTTEYLNPPLQALNLAGDEPVPLPTDASGAFHCRSLEILLRLEEGKLVLYDARTRTPLLTEVEAERAAREAEQAAREAAEREVSRLREELRRLRSGESS
jgi:Uma2 family endonuclease